MKNLDALTKAIADEKAATPAPAPLDLSKLSTDDVEKIASRVVEMLSERTPDAPRANADAVQDETNADDETAAGDNETATGDESAE